MYVPPGTGGEDQISLPTRPPSSTGACRGSNALRRAAAKGGRELIEDAYRCIEPARLREKEQRRRRGRTSQEMVVDRRRADNASRLAQRRTAHGGRHSVRPEPPAGQESGRAPG